MKFKSKDSLSLLKKILSPLMNKYSLICFILFVVYVGTWPLWFSKNDWSDGNLKINFLSDKPVKVYHYFHSHPIKWLESLENIFTPAIPTYSGTSPAPLYKMPWVNQDRIVFYAHRFYYPLEWLASIYGYQSFRIYYLTNADNIRKFNSLSLEKKYEQFDQLKEYHGKLLYLRNDSYNFNSISNNGVNRSTFQKYENIYLNDYINSNWEVKSRCYGGYDDFCYSKNAYDIMLQEAFDFANWYNQHSLNSPVIKMIESKRIR